MPFFLLTVFAFCASIMQILLFREILPVFQGGDFVIGIETAHFILVFSLGCFTASMESFSNPKKLKQIIIVCIPLFIISFIFSFIFIRGLRDILNIALDGGISLKATVIYIFYAVFFPSFFSGLLISTIIRFFVQNANKSLKTAFLYFVSSIIAGYIVYGLFVFRMQGFLIVLIIATALIILLSALIKFKTRAIIFCAIIPLILLMFPKKFISYIDKISFERNFDKTEVLDYKYSAYGQNVLIKNNNETLFLSNHILNFSYPDNDILGSEDFVHISILHHEKPKNVLIISGAVKYLQMILEHNIETVDYVEPDSSVIDMIRGNSAHLENIFNDKRLHIHHTNARAFIKNRKYDLILIGLAAPINLGLNSYYTKDFFKEAAQALNQNGFLSLRLPGTMAFSTYLMANINKSVLKSLQTVFTYLEILPGNQNILIASQNKMPLRADIKKRLEIMQANTLVLSKYYLDDKMDAEKIRWLSHEFERAGNEDALNKDSDPKAMIFSMLHWHSRFSPNFVWVFERLNNYTYLLYFIAIIAFFLSKRIHTETSFAFGLSSVWLTLIAAYSIQIYSGQIFRFASIILAVFAAGFYLGIISGKTFTGKFLSNTAVFYIELSYCIWIILWGIIFMLNLINVPILLFFVLGTSFLGGIEINNLIINWDLLHWYVDKKFRIYLALIIGGWIAAIAGGGFLILSMGIQKSLIFILFVKFIILCRWADLKKKIPL